VIYEIVKCDNCGEEYIAFDTDNNEEPFWHRVCDTCYMPMKVKNPFCSETKLCANHLTMR
jgi:formylmethanofuran dehydrogenase subunit E